MRTVTTSASAELVGARDYYRSQMIESAPRKVMQFTRIVGAIEEMQAWNASSNAASFVISHESRSGAGFHGQAGLVASWRPIDQNRSAVSVGGSPFNTLGEAVEACNAMAAIRTRAGPRGPRINFDARAVLRNWPSIRNERRAGIAPHLLVESTLDEYLRSFAKPTSTRHLYEIQTAPRPPFGDAILPEAALLELATLRGI
jgi:hypothetical protein